MASSTNHCAVAVREAQRQRSLPGPGVADFEMPGIAFAHAARFLGAVELSRYRAVCRAWGRVASQDELWRPLVAGLDPFNLLGEKLLKQLVEFWSWQRVVQQLTSQRCASCRRVTPRFFVLTCARVCDLCFKKECFALCSEQYAVDNFLLSREQRRQLPTFVVEDAQESLVAGQDNVATLTSVFAAKMAAVRRFGSLVNFETELAQRKARVAELFNSALARSRENGWPAPPMPAIMGLNLRANLVAEKQRFGYLKGSKYGQMLIISRAFFEATGRKFVIHSRGANDSGNALRHAVTKAPEGCVIEVKGQFLLDDCVSVDRPILLLGSLKRRGNGASDGGSEDANGSSGSDGSGTDNGPAKGDGGGVNGSGSSGTKGDGIHLTSSSEPQLPAVAVRAPYAVLADLTISREIFVDGACSCCIGCEEDELMAGGSEEQHEGPVLMTCPGRACIVDNCDIGFYDCGEGIRHERGHLLVSNSRFTGSSGMRSGGIIAVPESLDDIMEVTLFGNDLPAASIFGSSCYYPQGDEEISRRNTCASTVEWRREM